MWLAIFVSLTAFIIATLIVGWLARAPAGRLAIDKPNARSLHTTPVPRTGGIGLLLGIAAGWVLADAGFPWSIWIAFALVILISLVDDFRGLSAAIRFTVHLIAAGLAATAVLGADSLLVATGAILAMAWMCNLYNFMDGSDGLAGGMTLFGFVAYAVAAAFFGDTEFAVLNLSVAAAAAGFLVYNFHPARIFLGDAGSVPLGFLASLFGLLGWQREIWAWWFPVLIFSPFIVDASVTLTRRLLTGARVWEAHRDHYYQRLVQLGLGHQGTALAEYSLMTLCAIVGVFALSSENGMTQWILGSIGMFYFIAVMTIERIWKIRKHA